MTRAAELCGVSRLTAAEWFRRYGIGGIAELLCLKTVPGRQRAVSAEVAEELKKHLPDRKDSAPMMRYGYGSWRIIILIFLIKLFTKLSVITSGPGPKLRVLRI